MEFIKESWARALEFDRLLRVLYLLNNLMKAKSYKPLPLTNENAFFQFYLRMLFGVGLLFLCVYAFIFYGKVEDRIESQAQTVAVVLDGGIYSINIWGETQRLTLQYVAEDAAVAAYLSDSGNEAKEAEALEVLKRAKDFNPYYESVYLVKYEKGAQAGRVALGISSYGPMASLDLSEHEYLRMVFEEGYEYYFSQAKNNAIRGLPPVIVAIRAVRDKTDGRLLGAALFDIDLGFFADTFGNLFLGRTGSAFIIDSRGMLLSYPFDKSRMLTPYTAQDGLPSFSAIAQAGRFNQVSVNGRSYFFLSRKLEAPSPVQSDLYLVFRQEAAEVLGPVMNSVLSDLLVALCILGLALVVLVWSNRRFVKAVSYERLLTAAANLQLRELTMTDGLTGLYNRLFYREQTAGLKSYEGPLALLFFDIDGLKLANDAFGHAAGDVLVLAAAAALKGALPKLPVMRIGGDEFAVWARGFTQTDVDRAFARVNDQIASINSRHAPDELDLNISMGSAVMFGPADTEELVKRADAALYAHKSSRSAALRKTALAKLLQNLRALEPAYQERIAFIDRLCVRVASFFSFGALKIKDLSMLVVYNNLGLVAEKEPATGGEAGSRAQAGYRIAMYMPEISGIADLILKSAEHYDGSGPLALQGSDIPLECRIYNVCRSFDAWFVHFGLKKAKELADDLAGHAFDPQAVDILLNIAEEIYQE